MSRVACVERRIELGDDCPARTQRYDVILGISDALFLVRQSYPVNQASPFGWHADAGCGARAGRGPVARSTRERARSVDEHEGPPTEPGLLTDKGQAVAV